MSLVVQDLTKRLYDRARGEFMAVDGVSFRCEPGQIFGLLGPNGAGKTTILRMIAGILRMTSGTIELNGIDVQKEPEKARQQLGLLSSDTGLYERLTPREILRYFGELSKYPKEKLAARIDHLIKTFEIESFANTRCGKLSTGMRQRVSIARSIVHDPPILCFDEPTNGLDVLAIIAMHDFIKQCKREGKCVIFSTHIMSDAEKLCDEIGILHKGKLLALGSLEALRKKTGQHYLEDIFVSVAQEKVGELELL